MKVRHHNWLKLWFDRLLSKSLVRQIAVLGVVLFVLFLLSWCFLNLSGCKWKDFADNNDLPEWLLPLYLLIDTNAFNNLYINGVNGWALVCSSITFLIGAFIFNGAIIGIITNSIEQRIRNHKEGHIHYLKSGHYIIMGYDDIVPSIINHIFQKDKNAYVLLMGAMDAEVVHEKLKKRFSNQLQKKIILNFGHRTSTDYYEDIHLESAEEIFIVGNHKKPTHDAINVECVDSIYCYLSKTDITERPSRITCVFNDLDTYAAFKTSDIFNKIEQLGVEFVPYNFYSGWAKQVFVKRCYRNFENPDHKYLYPSVFGKKGITENDAKHVHLVFVGTTNFAVAFAMEAAHVLHFPNFASKGVKTRITFIDVNADKEKDEFITRNRHFFEVQQYLYRDLSAEPKKLPKDTGTEYLKFTGENANFLDVEFEFIKGDVFSKKIQDEISDWAEEHKNEKQCLSIFLALTDQRQNFVMGMNMPDEVYDCEVPVFIRQDRSDNFVTNLRTTDERQEDTTKMPYTYINNDNKPETKHRQARYANIYPFGMNETAFSADDHSLKRAKLINYLYETANYDTHKFQSILVLDTFTEDKIWEEANAMWKKLSVALKWSNLYNSYTMRTKQRTLRAMRGLDIDDESHDNEPLSDYEVKQLAIVEHNRWNVEKLLMGFRKPHKEEDKYEHSEFADKLKKNKNLFIHHDIRPYSQLDTIKTHDEEFSRYLPWIMRMAE